MWPNLLVADLATGEDKGFSEDFYRVFGLFFVNVQFDKGGFFDGNEGVCGSTVGLFISFKKVDKFKIC